MNLCRTIFGVAAGVALLVSAVPQKTVAQSIADQYDLSVKNSLYEPQGARGTIIPRNQFVDIFSGFPNPDDGVAGPIPLGFTFEYDNQEFDQVYISVNGFINFGVSYITNDPMTVFSANNGPNLTIAPYFGDHYLRVPGYDDMDPQGRKYTPSYIRFVQTQDPADAQGNIRGRFIVEWENLNVNYYFDPNAPDDQFSPNRRPQATSIASFQVHLIESPANEASRQGDIEFHYGPAGTNTGVSIVKFSDAAVAIESDRYVPNGATSWMNAVAWLESGMDEDSLRKSTRLTSNWPPAGFPGRIFAFEAKHIRRIDSWGDGDANLTQLDVNMPQNVRADQRRFVTFADVIHILRHTATRNSGSVGTGIIEFDSVYGRHGFHGDVNHNGRFYYSSSKWNNGGDSLDQFGRIVRYRVDFPTKDVNPNLPFPQDNTFNGFLFDADEFDASLVMLYLAAKLPVLPWMPDTLPPFTPKVSPTAANNVRFGTVNRIGGNLVEIPVYFNGDLNGSQGLAIDAAKGTRIVEVRTAERSNNMWVEAASVENRMALAAAGRFQKEDLVATLVVEANDNGDVIFSNVRFGEANKGMTKFNINNSGVVTGEAGSLSLTQNSPNPFAPHAGTKIGYSVAGDGQVTVRVFDVLGREIRTLVNGDVKSGSYTTEWDGLDMGGKPVESGVYYYQISAGGESVTRSMQVRK